MFSIYVYTFKLLSDSSTNMIGLMIDSKVQTHYGNFETHLRNYSHKRIYISEGALQRRNEGGRVKVVVPHQLFHDTGVKKGSFAPRPSKNT